MPIARLSRNGHTPSAGTSALAELRYRADSDLCLFRLLPGLCLLLSRRRREAVTIPTVAMGAVIVYLQLELEPSAELSRHARARSFAVPPRPRRRGGRPRAPRAGPP